MDLEIKDLINSSIKSLTPYEPGKPIEDLEREYGIKNAVKLASNESPLGPSPKVLTALEEVISGVHRYPDGNGFRLKEALSSKHSVDMSLLTLGNGSNDIIEFVARCFLSPKDNAIYSKYAFAVYPLIVQALGAEGIEVEAKDWGHDLQSMLEAINKDTKIVFIANPNNPTGTFIKKNEMIRFLEKVPSQVIVLLDQAYFDYSNYESEDVSFSLVEDFPNLVISRTFSKAYGLAGLRGGYSVSSSNIADYLNRVRQPFNVNSLALAAAESALKDDEHLEKCLRINKDEKERLYKYFISHGYDYIESFANFVSFDCKDNSNKVFKSLLPKGVIARSMDIYKMPNHLRVTIGLPEENSIFMESLTSLNES